MPHEKFSSHRVGTSPTSVSSKILTNYIDCHVYGLTVILAGMWVGSFTCGIPAFDLEAFCRKMEQYKATWAHIVPPVAIQLANSDLVTKYDLSSLKLLLIAAAPTKRALQQRLKARFGADTKIVQGGLHGVIESGEPCSTLSRLWHVRVFANSNAPESGRR